MRRLLAAAVAVFALTASLLAWNNVTARPWRFDWPDEMSVAYFAGRIAGGAPVEAKDPDIAVLEQRLHPRSVNIIGSALVPAGFLGLPLLLGAMGRLFGLGVTLFVTPALAALSGIALFIALRGPLSTRHAALSAVLFLFHPGVWYFSAYTHLPNVSFLALAIVSVAGMTLARSHRRQAVALLFASGAAAGLALGIRLSEAIWALPLLVGLLVLTTRGASSTRLGTGLTMIAWMAGAGFALLPTLFLQQAVYGSLLAGYASFGANGAALPPETVGGPLSYVLPFGLHPLHALARLWDSFIAPFWWYALFAIIGAAMAGYAALADPSRKRRRFARAALVVTAAVCGYLVLLYGSWRFADPLTLALNTVGRSYVRYWLPLALAMSIAAAAPLARIEGFPEMRVRVVGRVLLALLIVPSFLTAFVWPNEALWKVRGRIGEYRAMAAAAEAVVPEEGIILTQRLDKAFFPERRVIALSGSIGEDRQAIELVARYGKQYRFFFADALTPDEDIAARSEFMKRAVDARLVARLRADVPLYELIPRR